MFTDTATVDFTYDDSAGTISAVAAAGYTDEQAQDAVGTILADTSTLDLTYSDGTPSISGAVLDSPLLQGNNSAYHLLRTNHTGTQLASTISDFSEAVDDRVDALIQDGTGLAWTYDDGANTLTGNVSITQYTDELAQDATGAMAANSARVTLTYVDGTPSLTPDLVADSITNTYINSAAAISMSKTALTVTDSTSIDFTYSGNDITGVVPDYYRKATSPPSPLPWIYIEDEGTINRLINPRFETDLTDWTEFDAGTGGGPASTVVTLTRETTGTYIGVGVGKVVVGAAVANGGVQTGTYAKSAGVQEQASVWLKGDVGGEQVNVQLVGDSSGATSGALTAFTLTTSYRKYPVAKTPTAGDTTLRIRIINTTAATCTYYIGAAQLERKSSTYGTSYSETSLGQGYAASNTRSAGTHHLGTIADNSGGPFQIGSDGAIVSSGQMVFRGERNIPINILADTSHFLFTGPATTSTLTAGDEVGILKVRNELNGNVFYVDADAVTTANGVLISAGSLTTGYALAIGVPSSLGLEGAGFTGEFFGFLSKSGLQQYAWSKIRQKMGDPADILRKYILGYGGGKFSSATTAMTGTISSSGVNVTGTGTNFDPEFAVGDLIVAAGQTRRVATRASDTALTTNTAFSPVIAGGTAIARANDQYKPMMYVAERSTSTLTDGTSDHSFADTAAPFSALLADSAGRWRTYRGTANNTVPAPTADTDSQIIPQEIGRSTTETQSATSTSEDTLMTLAIPTNILGTTGRLWFHGAGLLSSVLGTATCTLRWKLGATTLFTEVLTPALATDRPYAFDEYVAQDGAANAQKTDLFFTQRGAALTALGIAFTDYVASSVDMSAAASLVLTAQWSVSNAANKITLESWKVMAE